MDALAAEGQAHLFADWPAAGEHDDDKRRLLAQLRHLDKSYAGAPGFGWSEMGSTLPLVCDGGRLRGALGGFEPLASSCCARRFNRPYAGRPESASSPLSLRPG